MLRREVLVCGLLALAGCGRDPANGYSDSLLPVSVQATPVPTTTQRPQATLLPQAEPQAMYPLGLTMPSLTVTPMPEHFAFPQLPRSTVGIWANATATPPTAVIVAGGALLLGLHPTLVFVPLTDGKVEMQSASLTELSLTPVAAVDTAGGGFEPVTEPPFAVVVGTSSSRLADPKTEAATDTWGRVLQLTTAQTEPVEVVVERCDQPGLASMTVRFDGANPPAPLWLSAEHCLRADRRVELQANTVARHRRFSKVALRPVAPTMLALITTDSTAIDLSLVRADGPLVLALTSRDAPASLSVKVGACGAQLPSVRVGGWLLVTPGTKLCAEGGSEGQVSLTAVGVITPRTEVVSCDARPRPAPFSATECSATDVIGKLKCIPGLTIEAFDNPRRPAGTQTYFLTYAQPSDHFRPDGEQFHQRLLLTLRDETAPMVLHTTGYNLFGYTSDVAAHFPVNELEVEHRFFEGSTPPSNDYATLTIMQSAFDSHRLVEALGRVFQANWVNTGHSKGGMTALFHRRFFPCDVAGSAPYVTPISFDPLDERYGPWLAQLGGPAYATCRQSVREIDHDIIERRLEISQFMEGTYARVGSRTNALYLTSGYKLWGAFQGGRQDSNDEGCPLWESLRRHPDYDEAIPDLGRYYGESVNDQSLAQAPLDAYSYQTQNELGSPGHALKFLEDLGPLPALPSKGQLLFGSVPLPRHEPRAMRDVIEWLGSRGDHFAFLYGEFDPWTGGQVDVGGARDTVKLVVPKLHHGVSLSDLDGTYRTLVEAMLQRWLGVPPLPRVRPATTGKLVLYRDVMSAHPL